MDANTVSSEYVLPLADPRATLETVGGKGASLARLVTAGLPVPDGFHITTTAYRRIVAENDLQPAILAELMRIDVNLPHTLEAASTAIQEKFARAQTLPDVAGAIAQAYAELAGRDPAVAVRSSATAEDLPNVLYEVANESSGGGTVDQTFAEVIGLSSPPEWGDSTGWQYWVINSVKQYELEQGYDRHPIGMTMQYPVADQTRVNEPLFNSPADWISPGYDDDIFADGRHPQEPGSPPSHWYDNPPAADGRKVIITDTDHYAAGKGDALWAWKSFLRGHNPILMDFGLIEGINPSHPASEGSETSLYHAFEPARYALGDTLHYAQQVNLIEIEPNGELSSTGYVLANPGVEYLVLQPDEAGGSFEVELAGGSYLVQWHNVDRRETREAGEISAFEDGSITFKPPFVEAGPAVLYLRRFKHG